MKWFFSLSKGDNFVLSSGLEKNDIIKAVLQTADHWYVVILNPVT